MNYKRVLFAYNGPIEKDTEGNFLGNELNDTLLDRYKIFGDFITFLIRVRLVSGEDMGRLNLIKSTGFSVVEVPEFNTISLFIKNKHAIDQLIRKTVAEHDVMIARLPSYVGRMATQYAKEMGKPYFIEAVGCPWDALWNHSWRGRIFAPIAYFQMKSALSKAPFVLYVTREFLQNRYPSSGITTGVSDVVLNVMNESCLTRRLEKFNKRKEGDPLVIGTVAAIDVVYKGQEYVIRAVAKLKALGVNVLYKMVGRGDKSRLQNLINELGVNNEVEIIGQIAHDNVFDFLDSLDLYVQPSKQEGLPRAVVEAMSRACPCLGARTGGIPELLNPDMVFEKGDRNAIVNVLSKVTNELLISEAKRSFEVAKSYSVELLNQRRNAFYRAFQNSYSTVAR